MSSRGLSLQAGPLHASFDRGELRWVRLGDVEVLRGIYIAVRGPGWKTVPPRLDAIRIEQKDGGFVVTYDCRHEDGPLRFSGSARIEGRADGETRFVFEGRAETAFDKNRIGLCVLHPTAGCAGRPCEIEHGDGRVTHASFPDDVAPHQPFLDIRAIRHGVAPGRQLEVRFDGEWFEMEDQRNWSDTSFKTYSTPLSKPFPARLEAGDRVRHEVSLRLLEVTGEPGPGRAPGLLEGGAAPSALRLGLDVSGAQPEASSAEVERLRALRLDHLQVRLDPEGEWNETLRRAAALARACQTRLEVAALVGEDGSLERLAESAAGLSDTTFFVFHRETRRSDAKLLARAGGLLKASAPGSRVGGGTDAWFADLNRNREAAQGADPVAFALCPQLHARDEATILENVASLPDMARTARGFAGRAELVLAPVGLAPPEESPDPRLASELGGEWVKRLLQSARTAGFSAITLRPGIGPGGIAATETPAWRVLRDR